MTTGLQKCQNQSDTCARALGLNTSFTYALCSQGNQDYILTKLNLLYLGSLVCSKNIIKMKLTPV